MLGGGLGLLAVALAERQPATVQDRNRRGQDDEVGDDEDDEDEDEPEVVFEVPERTPAPPPAPTAPAPRRPTAAPAGPRRVARRPDGVRRSQVAVEGAFGDVGVASLPRRLLALVGLVLVVLAVGVMLAVVIGAAVGAGVELFDQTFR